MTVTVEVDTKNWDQTPDNSYVYEKKTYTAVTNATGDYTLTIPATDKAYNVVLRFGNVYTTRNNYSVDGTVIADEVRAGGNTNNVSIYSGANLNVSHEASVSVVNSSAATEYGEATIRGTVYGNSDWTVGGYEDAAGTDLVGKTIKFTYRQYYAPYNNGEGNIFTAVIGADGTYEIKIPTELTNDDQVRVYINIDDFIANYVDGAGDTQSGIYSEGQTEVVLYDGDIEVRDLYFDVTAL